MGKSSRRPRSSLGSKRRLPSGRWQVRVTNGYRADGSPRVVSETVDTEADADRRIVEIAAELGRRPDLARGVTLSQYWAYYSATKGKRLTRAAYLHYESEMRRNVLPRHGDMDISAITHADVQELVLRLPTRSKADRMRRAYSAVMGQAVADGALASNPCLGHVEMPGDVGVEWEDESVWDDDPFAVIEGRMDVWDARTVLRAMPMLEGTPLETAWLAMVGAGLRMEEAFALRWRDVRRAEVGGVEVTQLAVHHANTVLDGRKRTKTGRSVRIVAVAEPFGSRLWELRGTPGDDVCPVSRQNASRRWKALFTPCTSKHARKKDRRKGLLVDGVEPPIPFVPLSRMRHTHETFMQQAGVSDSLNAAMHGHSQKVAYGHYMRPDTTDAAVRVGDLLVLEGGRGDVRTNVSTG